MAGIDEMGQNIARELPNMSPVGGAINAAQAGGQQLLNLLMNLFQQQQAPQAPLPFAGQAQAAPAPTGQQRDLRSRMTSVPPGGTY